MVWLVIRRLVIAGGLMLSIGPLLRRVRAGEGSGCDGILCVGKCKVFRMLDLLRPNVRARIKYPKQIKLRRFFLPLRGYM